METIRVNMTPCEDIKTIHASQNDNEAREWGFELHNNGEKIDSSSISDQLVFKAYEGGTEEILPTNGSTPTTSPFKGDIKYPQGLLSDQEFLYRESPTEEDGLAKITDIKGNTLVWNQLIQNGNFADGTNNWSGFSNTTTVSNNKATVKCINTTDQFSFYPSNINFIQNHKYLITFKITLYGNAKVSRNKLDNSGNTGRLASGVHAWIEAAFSSSALGGYRFLYAEPVSDAENDYYTVENAMIFDLTKMGLDISSPSEFTSLFPLPYYAYNQGTLLSFNGEQIKTVGFNQWDEEWEVGGINSSSGQPVTGNDRFRSKNFISLLPNVVYYAKIEGLTGNDFRMYYYDANKNFIGVGDWQYSGTFTTPNNAWFGKFVRVNKTTFTKGDICINISDTERNGTYEPYTESSISIPLDEFPNGMDGINDVWDEKNETGYKKKIGFVVVDGSDDEYWGFQSGTPNQCYHRMVVSVTLNNPPSISNYANRVTMYASLTGISYIIYSGELRISDMNGAITDVASLRAWLQAHPLVVAYALQEPLENYSVVDLGTLNWHTGGTNTSGIVRMESSDLRSVIKKPSAGNVPARILCNIYETKSADNTYTKNGAISLNTAGDIDVYDSNYNTSDKVSAFKQAMSGVYLLYEKENPQGFTTATLVTENGEVALANENGVLVGKCNSDVSANAGFIEGKIKLSDEDGDVYSNKIQLHIERSPQ